MFCAYANMKLTTEHAQDSSGGGDLGLGFVGGGADLDALEAEQRNDHAAEAEQQRDDHQSPTGLNVSCRGETRQRVLTFISGEKLQKQINFSCLTWGSGSDIMKL